MPEIEVKLPTLHVDQVRAYRVYQKSSRFVLRAGRRWGKNIFFETVACDAIVKGGYVGLFAPDYRILTETFNEIATILEPVTKSSSKVEGVIRTTTGGRLDAWTLNNPRAGRSRKYNIAIFDEAAFNEDDVQDTWERAVEPTLLDRNGKAIFASNAKALDEDNFFYKCHQWCGGENGTQFPDKKKPGYNEFWAPTRNNPHVPERLLGETEESHARRRQQTLDEIKATKHPLQWQCEFEARFIDFRGVAFFDMAKMLVDGQPVEPPTRCDYVFATIDTAVKTGQENDGTAVCLWARTFQQFGPHQLILLDWDIQQIEGSLLEAWLPSVFVQLEEWARVCGARAGSMGAWIEDKVSGTILLQQALRRGLRAHAIDSKLTALGKSERALSVSGYFYTGQVKMARQAFEKQVVYKGESRNHFMSQFFSFRVGDEDKKRADDLADAAMYGAAVSLGNAGGF